VDRAIEPAPGVEAMFASYAQLACQLLPDVTGICLLDGHLALRGQTGSLDLSLSGGEGPYAVSISWGDGSQSTILRKDQSAFAPTHAYKALGSQLKNYTIKIQAVDNNGARAFLQTTAVVRGSQLSTLLSQCTVSAPAAGSSSRPVTNALCDNNTALSLLSRTKHWVWLVWPTYAVVVLMLFSFWLGERQEVLVLLNKKQPKRRR